MSLVGMQVIAVDFYYGRHSDGPEEQRLLICISARLVLGVTRDPLSRVSPSALFILLHTFKSQAQDLK